MTAAPDFGHLEPMLDAAQRELLAAGVTETPGVLRADAGYWHQRQMERIADRGIPVLIPPDASRGLRTFGGGRRASAGAPAGAAGTRRARGRSRPRANPVVRLP